jgi:NAD(P)-dependent dehydrogenase (short-subunit alcohol dehydrogenase family)
MTSRIALVVGAGGGLGHVTAVTLAATGLTVVAVDRSDVGLKDLPDGIRREVADATDPAVAGPLVERIAAEVGAPDILINTLGAFEVGDTLSVTPHTLGQMMDVNLGAAIWLTQAVVPHMQQKGAGAIVHVSARPGSNRPPASPRTAQPRPRSHTWSAHSTSSCARAGSA